MNEFDSEDARMLAAAYSRVEALKKEVTELKATEIKYEALCKDYSNLDAKLEEVEKALKFSRESRQRMCVTIEKLTR